MADLELGHYLRLLRIKNNLTMAQTSETTGVTQGYISQIENGIYSPSAKTLAKLAKAYSVPEMHLLRRAGIVEGSVSVMETATYDPLDPVQLGSEPLEANETLEMLRRGLEGLEQMTQQAQQRRMIAGLPPSREELDFEEEFSGNLMLPVYSASWQPMQNAGGEAAGLALPAHFCGDDESAFILVVADNSMSPLVHSGDWVVISPTLEPENGSIVAINDRRLIQLRRYTRSGYIESYMPLNPEFASRSLITDGRGEKVELVGRVLRIVNRPL